MIVRAAMRRFALPAGVSGVSGGLLVLGLCSYAFLALAGRALSPADFATLSVLYALVYTVGPGLFLPLEQEVGRALAERRVRGEGGLPVLRKAAALGLALAAAVVVLAVALGRLAVDHLFAGSVAALLGLLLSCAGLWGAHLSRGALAGTGRFKRYGLQLAIEGIVRVLGCGSLFLVGVRGVGAYGFLLGGALIASVVLTVPRPRTLATDGPLAGWADLSGSLGWLLASALLSQALVNAGPVAVRLLAGPGEQAAAGALLAGLVLARLPLFLFAAVQASLLPGLASLLAAGRKREFVHGVLRLVGLVAALMAVSTVAAALLGHLAMSILFGPKLTLSGGTLAAVTLASGLYMVAVVLSQAHVALRGYGRSVVGWIFGLVVFLAVSVIGSGLVGRVVAGYLLGSLVAAIVLAGLLPGRLARHEPAADATCDLSAATGVEL